MIAEINKYVNQKKEIKGGENFCGSACVAMITGDDPQEVADKIGTSAADNLLTDYLTAAGWTCKKITDGGSAKTSWGFVPTEKDYEAIRRAIEGGDVVLYHFAGWDKKSSGHYTICKGYEGKNIFVFNDPAGDRVKGYFNDDGEDAKYTVDQLNAAGQKRCFAVWKE